MRLAIRLARQSLRTHKLRARLSTIGIVISITLVSLIFIISDSVKASLTKQVNQLNNHSIIINGTTSNSLFNLVSSLPDDTLLRQDSKYLRDNIDNSTVIDNQIIYGSVSYDSQQLSDITTIATSITNPDDLNLTLLDGNWFSNDEQNKKWVILGENLANKLIGTVHPQNQVIDIKGEKFTVVGVIKQTKQPLSILGYDIDDSAFISLDNGQKITDSDNLNQIIVTKIDDVGEIKRQITQILSNNHVDSNDFAIDTTNDIADRLIELVNYITIIACIVAGLVLLISCISIANIMLVNVVERRREIGIRKAVGATARNIIGQFIAESLIMSLRGGIIGLILAYAISAVILLFWSVDLSFSWLALGIGFAVPIITGIIAGVYPAYRASRQDIIEALNQLT